MFEKDHAVNPKVKKKTIPSSDLGIRNLKPEATLVEFSGKKGLTLLIRPTGTKVWIYRYMMNGKSTRMTFGHYPAVTMAEVNILHGEAMKKVAQGIDPSREKAEAEAKRKAEPTVADLLAEFWEKELGHSLSGKERYRLIQKDAIPLWGERKAASITKRDAVILIDDVRDRAYVVANRLQGVLVRMFNFAEERGIIPLSPLTGMKKKKEVSRERFLTDDEIKLLWAGLDLENQGIDIYRVTKLALKMILVTGQRPGEVCGMTWTEINDGVWTIPAHRRMKTETANSVPLSDLALDIIEEARVYASDSAFVFRSSHCDGQITTASLAKAVSRHFVEIGITDKFTPHDLRRTCRTNLTAIGVEPQVAEKVIGHKLQGILAIYDRWPYTDEKKMALDRWSRKLKQLVGIEEARANNIIELKQKVV
jgi:integrase